jgi:hypothetical protein
MNGISILECALAAVAAATVAREGFPGPIMTLLILSSSCPQGLNVGAVPVGARLKNRSRRSERDACAQ